MASAKQRTVPSKADGPPKKKAAFLKLLRTDDGATLDQITGATGWLPHTARAMLTGLRKKGFGVDRRKIDGATRYAITAEPTE